MTYRAAWMQSDGVTPAPGPDLGQIQPGMTATVARVLKNIGDQPLTAVQFTLTDDLPGLTVTVAGQPLTVGEMFSAPGLEPGQWVEFTATRTVPPGDPPGTFSAFVLIRALAGADQPSPVPGG